MRNVKAYALRACLMLACVGFFAWGPTASAQSQVTPVNEGTEFWLSFIQAALGGGGEMAIVIASPGESVVTVTAYPFVGSGLSVFEREAHLAPGELVEVKLPAEYVAYHRSIGISGRWTIDQDAVRVVATNPVAVYGKSTSLASSDAFLALPVAALGLDYVVASYEGQGQQVKVVGTEDQTTVRITMPVNTVDVDGHSVAAGQERSVLLQRGEVLALNQRTEYSLTGTAISADKPVAVLAGEFCANVPVRVRWCDHLNEMIPPISSLGTSYLLVPTERGLVGDIFRVVAGYDDTVVKRNGSSYRLDRGEFLEYLVDSPERIESSHPVLVMQYMRGSTIAENPGDPSMMLVVPTAQFRSRYQFATLEAPATPPRTDADIRMKDNYANVVIPSGAIATLKLNGEAVDSGAFHPIPGTIYSYAKLPVALGSHSIEAALGFGLYVYGLGEDESYAYPGGMELTNINDLSDPFPPNVRTVQVGELIHGLATDSSDTNANGIHDEDEAMWGDAIGPRSEDRNRNGVLDAGEDLNGNGRLDRDLGLLSITLAPDAVNLTIEVSPFDRGALAVPFIVRRTDPSRDGMGTVVVTDISRNERRHPVTLVSGDTMQNVRVVETVSGHNITLDMNSFATEPQAVRMVTGGYEIEWMFSEFSLQGALDLSYEVDFESPVPGETREVSRRTVLEYEDLAGQRVAYELGPEGVSVLESPFTLSAELDKQSYLVGEKARFSGTITNLTLEQQDRPSVCVRVLDAFGELVTFGWEGTFRQHVWTFPASGEGGSFSGNLTASVPPTPAELDFDTLLSGAYTAQAMLFNGYSNCDPALAIRVVSNPFTITPESNYISVDGRLRLEKGRYHPTDRILATTEVRNSNRHGLVEGYAVRLQVLRPDGSVFGTTTREVPQLVPLNQWDDRVAVELRNEPPGIYTLVMQLMDASGSVVETRNESFAVVSTAESGFGLRGTLVITPDPAALGHPIGIKGVVTNNGNAAITGVPLKLRLIDPDSQVVLAEYDHALTLAQGAQDEARLEWVAEGVVGKTYWAVLSATVGSGANAVEQVLAQEGFQLTAQAVPLLSGVDGDGQTARPGEQFGIPLRVSVRHADGTPVAGVQVDFEVSSVDGAEASFPSGRSATTDAQGLATRPLLAGARAGGVRVTASSSAAIGTAVFDLEIGREGGGGGGVAPGDVAPGCKPPGRPFLPHQTRAEPGARVRSISATVSGMGPGCELAARVDDGNWQVLRDGHALAKSAESFHRSPLVLRDGDQITLETRASSQRDTTVTVTLWLGPDAYLWKVSTGARVDGGDGVHAIPVMSSWAMWLLVGLLALFGNSLARRQHSNPGRKAT